MQRVFGSKDTEKIHKGKERGEDKFKTVIID
jgi:hypothetical protein